MEFLDSEYVRTILSTSAQVSLTEKLIVVGIVWATMGRKVSKRFKELKDETQVGIRTTADMFENHLKTIERKFEAAVMEMRAMKETISKDLQVNSMRLKNVEDGLSEVKQRVERLETP